MGSKGLANIVLAAALSLNLTACDKREDVVLKEGKIGEYNVKVVQEVLPGSYDLFYLEMSDVHGIMVLKTPVNCSNRYFIKLDGEEALKYDLICENMK